MRVRRAPQVAAILNSLTIAANGNVLTLTLAIPEEQFEQLSPAQKQQKVRRIVHRQ